MRASYRRTTLDGQPLHPDTADAGLRDGNGKTALDLVGTPATADLMRRLGVAE